LAKVDRAGMMNSLEVRSPFLDLDLVNFVSRLPTHFKLRHGRTKWLFKESMRSLLPSWVVDRPKHGFAVPMAEWLRADWLVASATSVRQQSITFDELGHLTGGMSSWIAGDYRLFPQNGQLPQRWAALPLVLQGVRFPSLKQSTWWTSDLEAVGHQFLYETGN